MDTSSDIRNIETLIETYFHSPLQKSMGNQRIAQPFAKSMADLDAIESEQARLLRSTTLAQHNGRIDKAIRDGVSTVEVAKLENARNNLGYNYRRNR